MKKGGIKMPSKKISELADRQNEIALMVAGIEYTIKQHNEPLIAKRNKLVAEYNKLQKEKEKLLPKKEEQKEEK